jgi:hypothetical protein
MWLKGTPTIMIGEIEDPAYEQHLQEGPYIVFDDAALPKYKADPRIHFVPGHPVLRNAMPEVMKGLGVKLGGKGMMKWQEFERWGMENTHYGTPAHKAVTILKPLVGIGLVAGTVFMALSLLDSRH